MNASVIEPTAEEDARIPATRIWMLLRDEVLNASINNSAVLLSMHEGKECTGRVQVWLAAIPEAATVSVGLNGIQ